MQRNQMINSQPKQIIPQRVDVQQAQCETLSNGVRLYKIESNDFEVLRISFVFGAGTTRQNTPFVASATANMLSEGSDKYSAQQIAERLDFVGSYFDVNIDRDYSYISFCTLSKFVDHTLDVAREIILRPSFPEKELATYCAKRKHQLMIERTKPEMKVREAFAKGLFGKNHPYGTSAEESSYDDLRREMLQEFFEGNYVANNCFVVCSGKMGESELSAIRSLVEQIPQHKVEEIWFGGAEPTKLSFVEHKDAVQSSLRIGRILFARDNPDFVGMQVVATILGGYFGSRLMQSLREQRGYTYGVMAAMVNFERAGYFAIATQVGAEVTDDALELIADEMARLRDELMPIEELDLVKNIMVGEMMRILDGPFGIADVTIENILCGWDNTIIDRNVQIIKKMTPEHIQQLAQKYLGQEDMIYAVVGAQKPRFFDNLN